MLQIDGDHVRLRVETTANPDSRAPSLHDDRAAPA